MLSSPQFFCHFRTGSSISVILGEDLTDSSKWVGSFLEVRIILVLTEFITVYGNCLFRDLFLLTCLKVTHIYCIHTVPKTVQAFDTRSSRMKWDGCFVYVKSCWNTGLSFQDGSQQFLALTHSTNTCCYCSVPKSLSFPVSQLLALGGQSTGASASVLPVNIQGWLPLALTGLISLQSRALKSLLQHHSWKASILHVQLSLCSNSHIHKWLLEEP